MRARVNPGVEVTVTGIVTVVLMVKLVARAIALARAARAWVVTVKTAKTQG